MDKNPPNNNESASPSLIELLKKYTSRVDERETLRQDDTFDCQQQQQIETGHIEKFTKTVTKLQSNASSINIPNQSMKNFGEAKSNIDYKRKWEEAETRYRNLEKKYHQLETGTVKQLQDKIDQLQRDDNQFKFIKARIVEICSSRQLTNIQLEQLKLLVNSNDLSIETIANKNDFHQQTIKLRDILITHNNELLNRFEELMNKKRKRNQYENDLIDDNDKNN
ncbi:unnamed protein product [Rotaria magnacalcarata]|uniref:Uncharacterized protein n=2 Tax=Rotaria magnacalcarata TaxID=392030 RepID=A0A816VLB3_9BILA|nr:unnamed protein product [Rotaria magnacalcarata]CAF1657492.1 unnamed protein product [Rotaria magnacalcarata]CAF2122195.1 unnamed protein product [Rotaria magnacalcarata]CAF2159304.1 unnamed protein product [Rotaria magnacalcarata]CAF2202802.1 unnamed protein product [Rotaria magnacalcarata]